jgi:hypothetical protein
MNDSTLIEVYGRMLAEHRATVDDILIESTLRNDFVGRCQHLLGDVPEARLLRRLLTLRKRRRLPTSRGVDCN